MTTCLHPTLRLLPLVTLLLAACGGGGGEAQATLPTAASSLPNATAAAATGEGGSAAAPASAAPAAPAGNAGAAGGTLPGAAAPADEIDLPTRRRAAQATAGGTDNDCTAIRPFYWETGDGVGASVGGSVGRTSVGRAIRANTPMRYASASKWLYAAYVAQRRDGALQTWDERMLSMRSGYTHFTGCQAGQSIDACLAWRRNDQYEAATDGRFFYNGGHMQKHASLLGLGVMDAAALAAEMRARLGEDLAIDMKMAWPAGGAAGTPATYARFLRKMITGELKLGGLLGVHAVCASTTGCKIGEVLAAPSPAQETWHYAAGHWVEDDPKLGDGAFSSAGAFGFYPWIDADRRHYGIVARDVGHAGADEDGGPGADSARCGRLIRRAWTTGVAQ